MKTPILQLIAITLATTAAMATETNVASTAPELLAKYSAALDGLRSIIMKAEGWSDSFNQLSRSSQPDTFDGTKVSGRPMKKHFRFEFRSDGERHVFRLYRWGNVGSTTAVLPEDQPAYNSEFWDGRQYYSQNMDIGPNRVGSVGFDYSAGAKASGQRLICQYGELRGYFDPIRERLDAFVRRAHKIALRPETEMVNGSACHVIEAATDYGRVCLWIDPQHGYLAAKASLSATPGDRGLGGTIQAGTFVRQTMEITRFDLNDGLWVPMEAKTSGQKEFTRTREFARGTATYKCTEIILNPDHEALRSFDWQCDPELKEGARVHFRNQPGRYVWQGGKIVPVPGRQGRG